MTLLFLAVLTFGASIIGTIAGFGSSTIMLPIVVLFHPLPDALLLVGIIHAFNDFWEIVLFRGKFSWNIILVFGFFGIVSSALGANLSFVIPQALASRILGIILVGFVLLINFDKKLIIPKTNLSYGIGGSLSGVLAGMFGIGGPIRSIFLTSLNLPKSTYLVTIGILSLSVDATRIIAYLIGGAQIPQTIGFEIFLLIPISFIAAEIGKKILHHIPQRQFRSIVSLFLFIIGVSFIFT